MPSRTWFLVAALWFAGALAWLSWTDYAMIQNVVGIACGYPDTAAKGYDSCIAMYQSRASAAMWNRFFVHDCLWALLPALGILFLGGLIGRWRKGPRRG